MTGKWIQYQLTEENKKRFHPITLVLTQRLISLATNKNPPKSTDRSSSSSHQIKIIAFFLLGCLLKMLGITTVCSRVNGAWNNIANIEKELVKMGIPTTDVIKKHEVSNGNSWTCTLTEDGSYQVRALRHVLEVNNSIDERKLWWIKEVPIKVTCFVWRAKLG
ncbi:unnamed protein product [Lactuca saligna]|uniref:Reverse transcriptase zinc-binding domain-containing protein n=1 Tax=Lactuca saligna TaxID=75948 RepID=A0AA36EH36_LACSI|nr:unnamed protein product [Lactuca saligna]